MGRYDNKEVSEIKTNSKDSVYFPRRVDRNICLLTDSGIFKTTAGEILVCNQIVLANSQEQGLPAVSGTPAKGNPDGSITPGTEGVDAVPASAMLGIEYAVKRTSNPQWGDILDREAKTLVKAFEDISDEEITAEHMNEFFDNCEKDKPANHAGKNIVFVVTTSPGVSEKGNNFTRHSFSSPTAADEKVAAEAMKELGLLA